MWCMRHPFIPSQHLAENTENAGRNKAGFLLSECGLHAFRREANWTKLTLFLIL